MRTITLLQPRRLVFGSGCFTNACEYLAALPQTHVHIITSPSLAGHARNIAGRLAESGKSVSIDGSVAKEPTIALFYEAVATALEAHADCVLGLGGGSALDLAKLVAAFVSSSQRVEDAFGIGLLKGRSCHLVCMPTTAGTGSEVSPNAILLDEAAALKKGVISEFLVPDASFIDPELARNVPALVTAFTGLDALTHCLEAYTNKFAHPLIDTYALQGIRLCARHLVAAVSDGTNLEAREGMALASLNGGLCLGPVNTAAVHALAYPLGGEFHVPHGLSNAVLLPEVFRFNAAATPARHAQVALALGAERKGTAMETALEGARLLEELSRACGLSADLSSYGVTRDSIPRMASAALTVQRLLRNNPRELTQADAERIYGQALFR
ncbi:Alcohol dehydrogenase, class IV [Bryocella elongata]|uniref:Alcohol dehydrogenase, class IV n=1 Tax=Bryocella elongata TaxID=863522 RepID=A0A1H5W0B0_9BACT|nr:iron-containing alcohol dehydrogenase [Bryocella elongata]SEF92666.1 Alcohol dehydrogenase, class IV [Bryocella elongata]